MNCPGCNKNLASSLSVCPSCGTMMNDSVREELALKISPIVKTAKPVEKGEIPKPSTPLFTSGVSKPSVTATQPAKPPVVSLPPSQTQPAAKAVVQNSVEPQIKFEMIEPAPALTVENEPIQTAEQSFTISPAIPAPPKPKQDTAEITAKPTSPTLVEFRNKNAIVPEWRLQLQNAVRKRQDYRHQETVPGENSAPIAASAVNTTTAVSAPQQQQPMTLATSGATALQAEPIVEKNPIVAKNPKLAAALERIEQSRQAYYSGEAEAKPKSHLTAVPPVATQPQPQPKTFPHVVAASSGNQNIETPAKKEEGITLKAPPAPPKTFLIEKKVEKFDTNKLPPVSSVAKAPVKPAEDRAFSFKAVQENKIEDLQIADAELETADVLAYADAAAMDEIEDFEQATDAAVTDYEEIDDCAPVSLRFNAGLFDLLIGSFMSFILLSPFMLLNGNLFTFQGLLAFLATWAIVMFIYMTTTIGFLGKTFGMRLFSLEIVDIEENEYPSFHQAAVNSCVYLFSLALGGIGFLPLFFNSERRAAHDLVAGTIVVKEEEY